MNTHAQPLLLEGRKAAVFDPFLTLQQRTMISHLPAYSLLIPSDPPTTLLHWEQQNPQHCLWPAKFFRNTVAIYQESTLPQPANVRQHVQPLGEVQLQYLHLVICCIKTFLMFVLFVSLLLITLHQLRFEGGVVVWHKFFYGSEVWENISDDVIVR